MPSVTYRLPIQPSPTPHLVASIEFHAKIDGAPAVVLADALPPDTSFIEVDFDVDATVEWFALWKGNNGTEAACVPRAFVANDRTQVVAGSADPEVFVRYNP